MPAAPPGLISVPTHLHRTRVETLAVALGADENSYPASYLSLRISIPFYSAEWASLLTTARTLCTAAGG